MILWNNVLDKGFGVYIIGFCVSVLLFWWSDDRYFLVFEACEIVREVKNIILYLLLVMLL